MISSAILVVTLEKSLTKNAFTVFCWVFCESFSMSPISIPVGWGLISFDLRGMMSVALSKT